MYPTLLSLGEDLQFHAYTVMLAIAFLVGVLGACRENEKLPNPYPITPIGGLWVFFFALLGAKIYYILQYKTIADMGEVIYLWSGGLVFFGGLIGGLIGALLYLRLVKVSPLNLVDVVIPYVPLAHAFARIGCFLNGCCYGSPADVSWALAFPKDSAAFTKHLQLGHITSDASHSLHVHPTQLYATTGLIIIFLIMRFFYKRPHHTGAVALLYPTLYGAQRFTTEFFRGDSAFSMAGLTVSQVVALSLCLGGLLTYLVLWKFVWVKSAQGANSEKPEEVNHSEQETEAAE